VAGFAALGLIGSAAEPAFDINLLEAQGTPLDAWMYDSPFFQDFSEVGRVEARTGLLETQDTPLDAWMHDSPFFQDFSAAGRVEAGTGAMGRNSWIKR